MDNRPIGIFDSGVGGLSVVKTILDVLPNEEIIYFGDTKRAPYGGMSKEIITTFSKQIVRFLKQKNCKAFIIACNAICATSLEELKNTFSEPFAEVITPAVNEVIKSSEKGVIVLGTVATINSGVHKKEINKNKPFLPVYELACPLFVPIVEEGFADSVISFEAAKEYLKKYDEKNIDALILGCTHYPIMKDNIKKALNKNVNMIDPAYDTSLEFKKILEKNNMLNNLENTPNHSFYFSGDKEKFDTILKKVLNNMFYTEKIDIEIY